jgi:hypothetical protein
MDETKRLYPPASEAGFAGHSPEAGAQYLREAIAAFKQAHEKIRLAIEQRERIRLRAEQSIASAANLIAASSEILAYCKKRSRESGRGE